jgi:membrane-associated phospholipid phosphatase
VGRADRDAYLWITDHRVGWLDPVFLGLSAIGYAGLVWVGLALALSLTVRRPLLPVVAAVGATVWSVDLFVGFLKGWIDRPRPFRAIDEAHPLTTFTMGHSMPSGHAATSFAGAVMLSVFFRRALPWALLLATAIAFSRIYVGVHYPFDVLAGAAIGTVWALAWVVIFRRFAPRLWSRRPGGYPVRAP